MKQFTHYTPTKVIFGEDAELQVGEEIQTYGAKRIFVLYGGGSVVRSGLLGRIEQALAQKGLIYQLCGGVQPNPRLAFARTAIQEAIAFGADFVLAVGAGSVIDTAKAVAHGIANPTTDIWQFWSREKDLTASTPVGCVLTLSAAGSETSSASVLTNEETGQKRGLGTVFNYPKFAIMNPVLTYTIPQSEITNGIVDIMMHTLDRYFTPTAGNATTDAIAEALLRTVIENGEKAKTNKTDYDAMSELMWCGSLSHNGLTGLGAVSDFAPHQLGHELSAMFDVAHGASLSAIWGAWAETVYLVNPERFATYGRNVWGLTIADTKACALAAIAETVKYFEKIEAPTCYSELGIGIQTEEVLEALANRCMFNGTRTIGSFQVIDQAMAYEIYQKANR